MGGYEGRLLEGILRCNKGNSASNVSTITLFNRYKYIYLQKAHQQRCHSMYTNLYSFYGKIIKGRGGG
jgi:hypothetical protein